MWPSATALCSRPACRAHLGQVILTLGLALLILAVKPAMAEKLVPVPPLQAHVTDQIGLLQPEQRATLESVLSAYEARTGSQLALLLMSTSAPEAIEDYSIRVADAWKLGRKGVDDGVILIVAKDNPSGLRRLRIEAGRGVQGVLTDAQSKRVLQDVIAPYFQNNDFYGGLSAGVSAITTILDQQNLPAAQRKQAQPAADEGMWGVLAPLIFFGFIIFMMLSARRRAGTVAGNSLNHNVWGNAAGVVIGSLLSQSGRGFGGGDFGGGGGGGSFGGGGGGFDGGGASGNW